MRIHSRVRNKTHEKGKVIYHGKFIKDKMIFFSILKKELNLILRLHVFQDGVTQDTFCHNLNKTSFFKKRFYLFIHERHTKRASNIGKGRNKLPAESPMQDSIPGAWGHALNQRQTLNYWATQASPEQTFWSHRLIKTNLPSFQAKGTYQTSGNIN